MRSFTFNNTSINYYCIVRTWIQQAAIDLSQTFQTCFKIGLAKLGLCAVLFNHHQINSVIFFLFVLKTSAIERFLVF